MDGLDGLSGLAAIQARIADISARVGAFGAPAGGVLGGVPAPSDTSTGDASTADFASVLGDVASSASSTSASTSLAAPAAGTVPTDGDMRSPAARLQFAHDVLTRLGMPQTAENVRALVAWQAAEGTRAAYNPLATTRSSHQAGESSFNSVGVKNFPTYQAGVDTTIAALRNGLYGPILAALQRGDSAESVAQAVAQSRWGTGQAILRALPTTTM